MKILAWPYIKNRTQQPYNFLLYDAVKDDTHYVKEFSFQDALHTRHQIFHIHWPDGHLNIPSFLFATVRCLLLMFIVLWQRLLGAKIVWTVHNLRPHERLHPWLEHVHMKLFVSLVDGAIFLSKTSFNLALREFPRLASIETAIIPHGHYRDIYPNTIDQKTARRTLGIPPEAKTLLFLGQIRPYKNVAKLLHEFRKIQSDECLALIVAGNVADETLLAELKRLAESDKRIHLFPMHVPDADVQVFFNASDILVLPYKDVLNSGSAILGLSFNKPIIAPCLGTIQELKAEFGSSWLRTYEGDIDAKQLQTLIQIPKPTAPLDISSLDWACIGKTTKEYFRKLVQTTP